MARRDLGMSRVDALMDACHKRARPIVMTTVAMTAGMLPIVLGLHGDDSFRRPMGLVVVGGLITSTILSLLVVPVVRSEEHTSELQSLVRISYAVFCLQKKRNNMMYKTVTEDQTSIVLSTL